MDTKEVVEQFIAAFEKGELAASLSLLSDEFTFSGPVPEPMNAQGWMGIISAMRAGMPDIDYNNKIVAVDGNNANVTTQLTGTHTEDLDLSPMGMGVIPATGKAFSNPEEKGVMTVANGKITSYEIEPVDGGGLRGMLSQLGVTPPGA